MDIGDRVKVIDQEIIGTIIRHDVGNKVVILDDDDSWQEEGCEPSLTYHKSDLEYCYLLRKKIYRVGK